jgi:hypothetical protein
VVQLVVPLVAAIPLVVVPRVVVPRVAGPLVAGPLVVVPLVAGPLVVVPVGPGAGAAPAARWAGKGAPRAGPRDPSAGPPPCRPRPREAEEPTAR